MSIAILCLTFVLVLGLVFRKRKNPYENGYNREDGKLYRTKSDQRTAVPEESPEQESLRFEKEIRAVSAFYCSLNADQRMAFLNRAWIFYKQKQFVTRQGLQLTFQMKVMVSAYAAQLLLGFPEVRLRNFGMIIIYPEAYRSTITQQLHKGEVHREGAIVFSWSDLKAGHNVPDDGVNLALHELAHALHLENFIPNGEAYFLNSTAMNRFEQLAESEKARIRTQPNHFLRVYGATNDREFFAVCVENFFERPEAFCKALPELYGVLSELLRQNPLQRKY